MFQNTFSFQQHPPPSNHKRKNTNKQTNKPTNTKTKTIFKINQNKTTEDNTGAKQ